MDEVLLKQLVRQLKILNMWIAIGGTLMLVAFLVCIFLLFKVVTFMQDTSDKLNALQDKTQNSLNIQKQLCESDTFSGFLERKSELCSPQAAE